MIAGQGLEAARALAAPESAGREGGSLEGMTSPGVEFTVSRSADPLALWEIGPVTMPTWHVLIHLTRD